MNLIRKRRVCVTICPIVKLNENVPVLGSTLDAASMKLWAFEFSFGFGLLLVIGTFSFSFSLGFSFSFTLGFTFCLQ